MSAVLIIASTVGGAAAGGMVGVFTQKGADDMGIDTMYRLVCGAFAGGLAGVCVGSAVFA